MFVCLSVLVAACGDNSDGAPVQAPVEDAAVEAASDAPEKDAAAEAEADAAPEKDAAVEDAAVEAASDAPEKGFCDDVEEGMAALYFIAPQPRGDGFLAAAAWVAYPPYANRPDVEWTNPYPGCVAKFSSEQTLVCDFGPAFQGMKIGAIFGLNDGSPTGPIFDDNYFSWVDGSVITVGEVYACKGKTVVGTMKDGVYEGVLKADDDPQSANMQFVVP
ncbi:MAG: hypothetical protein RDU25_05340 [Patescibacteria group bacterium]|nr:hypothetical protein [Patescibacteria group bacterium]